MEQTPTTSTYVDRIMEIFAEFPDREAVVGDGVRFRYADARAAVLRLAEELRARGLRSGDTVALFTGNRPETMLVQLATHLIGGWIVFITPEPALPEILAFVRRAQASALIFDPWDRRGAELARQAQPRVVLSLGPADVGTDLTPLCSPRPGEPPRDLPADRATKAEISTLFYTGGTTGAPKMVRQGHNYYDALMIASGRRRSESAVPQRFLVATLLNHTSGHTAGVMTLLAGGTVVLAGDFDAEKVIQTLGQEHITSMGIVPPMLSAVLDHPSLPPGPRAFPDLVRIFYGSAPTTTARILQAMERFGPVLRQSYGMTEIPVITVMEPHEHDPSIPGRLTACGKPLPTLAERAEISLRDEHNDEVAPGAVGEVCVRGPLVMAEYWNDPEHTAKVLADGWLHSGDLGYFDGDGYLHLVDRVNDVIVTGINSVIAYSTMLEEVLTRQPGVRMAAVVGLPDETYGEAVHAVCVLDPVIPVEPAQLRKLAIDELGEVYEPKTITFVESLPLTGVGKIDKKAVRARLLAAAVAGDRAVVTG